MAGLDRPKLRPLNGRRVDHEGRPYVVLEDPLGVASEPFILPFDGFQHVVRHFNGESNLLEIQALALKSSGRLVHIAELEGLIQQLDQACLLDGPTFETYVQEFATQHTRPAAFAGRAYSGTERSLRTELARFFEGNGGAGMPDFSLDVATRRPIRAVLSPHIDFQRGGSVYSWAYRDLIQNSDADTFVIFGVAHQYTNERFVLTRKDFETPLGLVPTDRIFVDRIAQKTGDHIFQDELVHKTEHSIEFQVIFLQYLLGGRRDFSIVPILVGSFHDLMTDGVDPIDDQDVREFVEAVQSAEQASGKKIAYIGGIDLCHVGPEFGDDRPVDDATLAQVRAFDAAMLEQASQGNALGWFSTAGAIQNRWRVCGLAATYTMLKTIGPVEGKVLRYDQAVDARRNCCVSFASVSYEATAPG